jgi:hypothetical protein
VSERQILRRPDCDVVKNASTSQREVFSSMFEALILATDISDPLTVHLVEQKWKAEGSQFTGSKSILQRTSWLQMVLLVADIGIVIEPFPIFKGVVRRLFDEMRVVRADLSATDFAAGQNKFLSLYASRLLGNLSSGVLLQESCKPLLAIFEDNCRQWAALSADELREVLEGRREKAKGKRAAKAAQPAASAPTSPSPPQRALTSKVVATRPVRDAAKRARLRMQGQTPAAL